MLLDLLDAQRLVVVSHVQADLLGTLGLAVPTVYVRALRSIDVRAPAQVSDTPAVSWAALLV